MVSIDVDERVALDFLTGRFDGVEDVELIGEGNWSRCFGFRQGGRELVVRFGLHRTDFEKDRTAAAWRSTTTTRPARI